MKASKTKEAASWSDVKARLTHFDHDGLVGLVHDLYTANKDNQVFLHARFGLGADVLEPYKTTINRWLWPDMFRNQNASVAEIEQGIQRRHGRVIVDLSADGTKRNVFRDGQEVSGQVISGLTINHDFHLSYSL
jgi:hypothetical protein